MKNRFFQRLNSPIVWGGLFSLLFYMAIRHSFITNEFLIRYCAGHPVEYITVSMFFIGMASLFLKLCSIRHERCLLKLGPIFASIKKNQDQEDLSKVDEYIETVEEARQLRGRSLHEKRLLEGLSFLQNNGSVNELEQELRFLSEENAIRAEADYGMVRMFIWAIPILGFLGTVIGITMALGNLDLTELETSGKLLADGLKVAFDTTALALSLVFILYFSLFWVSGQENKLFEQIDRLVEKELLGRFASRIEKTRNHEFRALNDMFQTLAQTFEKSLTSQLSIWNKAIEELNNRSYHLAEEASVVLETVLAESLQKETRQYLQNINQFLSEQLFQSVSPLIESLERSSKKMSLVETQAIQQSNILLEVLHTTSEIGSLEAKLNRNLQTIAKSNCFEETLGRLAETVQRLNSQLGGNPSSQSEVCLQRTDESLLKKDAAVVVPFSKTNKGDATVILKTPQTNSSLELFENGQKKQNRTVLKLKNISNEEAKNESIKKENRSKSSEKTDPTFNNGSSEVLTQLEQLSVLTEEQLS